MATEEEGKRGAPTPEDRGTRVRLRVIGILTVAGIAMFIAGKYTTVIRPTLDTLANSRDGRAIEKMHEDFYRMFDEYGINRGWVEEKQIHLRDSGYTREEWTITVPRNMPLASLSNDIRQYAVANGGMTYAFENSKTAQLFIHLSVKGRIFMTFAFTSEAGLKREGGEIAVIVDGIQNASSSEIDALVQSRETIACIIVPDRDILSPYDKLQAAGREIVLHLHFSPNRQTSNRFSLSDDMKEPELLSRVRNILKNFPGARYFTITSERLQGGNVAIVSEELRKSGLKAIESSSLTYLDRTDGEETLATRFNDLSNIAIRSGRAFGVAELKDGAVVFLTDQMSRLRKRGFVFAKLSAMCAPAAPAAGS